MKPPVNVNRPTRPSPTLARLPLVALLAGLGFIGGGSGFITAAQAQDVSKLPPLLVDPALLGDAPAAPAALGGLATSTKEAAKKHAKEKSKEKTVAPETVSLPVTPAPLAMPPARSVRPASAQSDVGKPSATAAASPAVAPLAAVAPVAAPVAVSQPMPSTPEPAPASPAAPVPQAPATPVTPAPVAAQVADNRTDSSKLAPLADDAPLPTPKLQLKPKPAPVNSPTTSPATPPAQAQATQAPSPKTEQTELLADAITGRNDLELTATGNAELHRSGAILNADRMVYDIVEDHVDAQGNVVYKDPSKPGQEMTMIGNAADMTVAARTGHIDNVTYEIHQQQRVTADPTSSLTQWGPSLSSPLNVGAAPGAADGTSGTTGNPVTDAQGNPLLPGQTPLSGIIETTAHGQASRIYLQGEGRYKAEDATYTTCAPGDSGWYLRAQTYHADYEKNEGTANNSLIYFQDVPFFYTPYAFFPLDRNRHSGFLAPTFGSSKLSGFYATIPYYFNLAPNYDATVTPFIYGRRGASLNTDFRYIGNEGTTYGPTYFGRDAFNILPNDRLSNRDRWSFLSQHQQNLDSVLPGLSTSWDLQGVSDSYYFTDLNNSLAVASQSYLPRTGRINYGTSTWNASIVAQGYQTLQFNPNAPVATPYQTLPQFNFALNRSLLGDIASLSNVRLNNDGDLDVVRRSSMFDQPARLDTVLTANSTYFTNPGCALNGSGSCLAQPFVSGNRLMVYPQLVSSWQSPGAFITPKVGVNYTQYNTNAGLVTDAGAANGYSSLGGLSTTRTLPIVSLDSGLIFDRKTEYFGQALNQTFEPRVYYLYVPYRNQSNLPLFDTGIADVSYAQLFSENIFRGWDRISNANQLTAALTSRFTLDKTGQQVMSFSVGQRIFFSPQRVNLYASQATSSYGSNDYFVQATGVVAPYTTINGYAQISPYAQSASVGNGSINRINRASIGFRFQPSRDNVINYSYRYQNQDYITIPGTNTAVMQNDINGAWHLWGPWRIVGRYTYSGVQSSQIESLIGLEYNTDCWAVRAVYHRAVTFSSTQAPFLNTSFFIQLELKGLGSVGSSPLDVLRRNIPNYTRSSDAAFLPPLSDPYY